MKSYIYFCILISIVAFGASGSSAIERDLYSDNWVATDALRRQLPTAATVRPLQKNKFVGVFYFVWHGGHGTPGPYDITKLLTDNPTNSQWGPEQAFHWWGEPEAGYYVATDPWVIRRNLSMLQDAGADVLFLDVTNAFTYPQEVQALCEVAREMRREGNMTPQIGFLTHSYGPDTVKKIYEEFYAKNLYPELWFRWQGKPLMLGERDAALKDGSTLDPAIKDFFTWRYSWAWDSGQGKWQWIDTHPQDYGWDKDPKIPEQLPVAVASHPTLNIGRSYHNGKQPPVDKYAMTATAAQGLHFTEQWKRLLEVDPAFAFITGWNEWVAQRFVVKAGQSMDFLGKRLSPGDTFFVDAYNQEFNRDIEPMKGGSTDNYYYQMISGIRSFKGVRKLPPASPLKKIVIDGAFMEWANVTPEYRDTIGDTAHRNWKGWGGLHYTNTTGRNDIISTRVACDAANIYFYVETRNTLSKHTDPAWMLLFIDADLNPSTGWNGYDYVVNNPVISSTRTSLKRISDGKTKNLSYRVTGNKMEVKVPRSFINQANKTKIAFDFHWADNIQPNGDITQFSISGDSAPNRRFNYRYEKSLVN